MIKFNQKIPIRINRITGTTEMFSTSGWSVVKSQPDEKPAISEMDAFKQQINSKLAADEASLKDQLKNEILLEINKDIEARKNRELDQNNYFGQGSSMDDVKKIMGTPTSITKNDFAKQETWYYDSSSITFKNGLVNEWRESPLGKKLKLK